MIKEIIWALQWGYKIYLEIINTLTGHWMIKENQFKVEIDANSILAKLLMNLIIIFLNLDR